MAILDVTAKISRKGQLTLPKRARERLGGPVVRVVVEEESVRLEPVPDLAGSLSQYARPELTPAEARDMAWEAAVHEKHGRR